MTKKKTLPRIIECHLEKDVNNIPEEDYYIDRELSKVRKCYVMVKRMRKIKKKED